MFVYEIFLPVTDEHGVPFPGSNFRDACDQLTDEFGPIETLAIYRPLRIEHEIVREAELCRCRLDVARTDDNQRWLIGWRDATERRFGCSLWMIRYRQI